MVAVKKPLFQLGQIVATPGALEALQMAGQTPSQLLDRHVVGDWGIVSEEDKEANDLAVRDGSRIMSAYLLKDGTTKVWIITEAVGDDDNRAATTLLLPEEY